MISLRKNVWAKNVINNVQFTLQMLTRCLHHPTATSGTSRISPSGSTNPPGACQHTIFGKISQKLHETERIWIPAGRGEGGGGRGASLAPPLDLPMPTTYKFLMDFRFGHLKLITRPFNFEHFSDFRFCDLKLPPHPTPLTSVTPPPHKQFYIEGLKLSCKLPHE